MLSFSFGNKKLVNGEVIFNLVAGFSCPFADKCLAFANRETGKLTDGKNQEFRCYAASAEAIYPNVRKSRWNNFELIKKAKTKNKIKKLILKYLPKYNLVYRIHESGDFFSQEYFDAWMEIARENPHKIFYSYTKALPFWLKRKNVIPFNFILNASYGGKFDHLIAPHKLKSTKVVYSKTEAAKENLKIDIDDSLAWQQNKSFALLIHGNGPKGSKQASMF